MKKSILLIIFILAISTNSWGLSPIPQQTILTDHFELTNKTKDPILENQIPPVLKDWIDWVKYNLSDNNQCPYDSITHYSLHCDWTASLVNLTLTKNQSLFSQQGKIFNESWVRIPGSVKFWPQEVMVNGKKFPVVEKNGYPQILLKKGDYTITGKLLWDRIPESIDIPPSTGILNIVLNGKKIDFPNLNKEGVVWLSQENQIENSNNDNLDLRIYRKVTDSTPLILTTHLDISVSGKSREIILDHALLPNFIPISVESLLPYQITADRKLKLHLKTGNWNVVIKARQENKNDQIHLVSSKDYPLSEIWVFEEKSNIRKSKIENLVSIDPEQTTLPDPWKKFQAYQINPDKNFTITEITRGNTIKQPDNLNLHRNIWLDFDGKGYTFNDYLSGQLNTSWRLNIQDPYKLGKVSLNDSPQLITESENKMPGVEVRQGSITLNADGRLNEKSRFIPANSWDQDLQKLSIDFHVPPGWKLMLVAGADHASNTWFYKWSLLDIFLILFISAIFYKLWGIKWGMISLIGLAFGFIEHDAPQYLWLLALSGVVFSKLNLKGKLNALSKFYQFSTLILLVLVIVPFLFMQLRSAIFPGLNYSHHDAIGNMTNNIFQNVQEDTPNDIDYYSNLPKKPMRKISERDVLSGLISNNENTRLEASAQVRTGDYASKNLYMNQVQWLPGAKVQTGPGLPNWKWKTSTISWNGPVDSSAKLQLYLLSPIINIICTVIEIMLIFLLLIRLVNLPKKINSKWFSKKTALTIVLLGFGLVTFSTSKAWADEIPSPEILKELENRLREPLPQCFPDCTSISKLNMSIINNQLSIDLDASALAKTAIPLPGNIQEWNPETVLLNDSSNVHLKRDANGILWLQLDVGQHQIVMKGKLPPKNQLNLSLPLKPHYVKTDLKGWSVEGVRNNGQVNDNIQLTRIEKSEILENITTSSLPAFFQVERHLFIGLLWKMETTITRLSPTGSPVLIEIPLLKGESPTTDGIQIKNNKAIITLSANQTHFSWESILQENETIHLEASDSKDWTEIWKLDLSPIWRANIEGIPSINQSANTDYRVPMWYPWSGEKVTIHLSRPKAIIGQTLTIDQSEMIVTPGARNSAIILTMNLISSLGGNHTIQLPEDASLKSFRIGNDIIPTNLEKGKLNINTKPGSQKVIVAWNQPGGIEFLFKNPKVDFGIENVNLKTNFNLGNGRWVLLAGGPKLGPAVLFWSYLIIIAIVAFILSKIKFVPIKFYQWFLLALGLSQTHIISSAIVIGWLLILSYRDYKPDLSPITFNLRQILIVLFSFITLIVLIASIEQGLLGYPDMQISGYGSSSTILKWYQDRSAGFSSCAWVISVPMYIYRIAMLLWALWMAFALIKWIKWGFHAFTKEKTWMKMQLVRTEENLNKK